MPCSCRSYSYHHRKTRVLPIYSRSFTHNICDNCVNKTDKNIGSYKINCKFVISVRLICNNKHILTITSYFLRANLVLESRINVPRLTNFGSTWIRFASTKMIISAISGNPNKWWQRNRFNHDAHCFHHTGIMFNDEIRCLLIYEFE